jgi:hypothetical protein
MIKGKEPDPDPYPCLWLMDLDPDPGGPKLADPDPEPQHYSEVAWKRSPYMKYLLIEFRRPVPYVPSSFCDSLWFPHVAAMPERWCLTQRWTAWVGGTDTTRPPQPSIFTMSPIGFFSIFLLYIFLIFGGLECVDHSFAYVAHFVFLRNVWIRTKRVSHPSP